MIENTTLRIWVNRVVAFVFGALVVFIIIQTTVVSDAAGLNVQLNKELDEIKYEPGRLLVNSKAFFESNDYNKAMLTLTTLFEKHPASAEVTEGKVLYASIEKKQAEMDKKWAAESPGVRAEWEKATIKMWRDNLKTQYLKDSERLDNDLDSNIEKEWNSVRNELRQKWETEL
jgi:hypothetical protein